MAAHPHLALTVRTGDYDRFLCIQLAPLAKREALYAVTAFHLELARIAESVSEPLMGHIRLAWWREALEEIAVGKVPRNHPVVLALAEHLTSPIGRGQFALRELGEGISPHPAPCPHPKSEDGFRPLPVGEVIFPWLLKMIEGRAADLDESLLADEAAWLAYLDATAGALHMVWALLLDAPQTAAQEAAIRTQARGYAMVGLARAIPYMAQQGFLRFPPERIAAYGFSALAPGPQLALFVQSLINEAETMSAFHPWPKTLRPLWGLTQLARLHLRSIRRAEYDPYHLPNARLAAVLRIIRMKFLLC